MFNKILCAADGSEHSLRAGEKAFELASLSQESKVDIIYVVDPKHSKDEVLKNRSIPTTHSGISGANIPRMHGRNSSP